MTIRIIRTEKDNEISPSLWRQIKRLHRQMERDEAAGGVIPPKSEIVNRRTGKITKFGPRRAFDGSYLIEVLHASGCEAGDIEIALWVLRPLLDTGLSRVSIKKLADVLSLYGEKPTRPKPKLTAVK
jgi:hypothetical protein